MNTSSSGTLASRRTGPAWRPWACSTTLSAARRRSSGGRRASAPARQRQAATAQAHQRRCPSRRGGRGASAAMQWRTSARTWSAPAAQPTRGEQAVVGSGLTAMPALQPRSAVALQKRVSRLPVHPFCRYACSSGSGSRRPRAQVDIEALVAGGGDPYVDSHNLMRCARVAPRDLAEPCMREARGAPPPAVPARWDVTPALCPFSSHQRSNNVGEGAADAYLEDHPGRQAAQLCSGKSMQHMLLLMLNAVPGCRSVVLKRMIEGSGCFPWCRPVCPQASCCMRCMRCGWLSWSLSSVFVPH